MLADLMLPDGAHDRNEDWTVFFLNQTPSLTVESNTKSNQTSLSHQDPLGGTIDPTSNLSDQSHSASSYQIPNQLLYVISLVRTKKDTSVRR